MIEIGLWTRGDAKDYADWARIVKDDRWNWSGFLPYFKKTETHFDPTDTSNDHGHSGPVPSASVSSSGRNYPLREPLRAAWSELGVHQPADINNGSPLGMAEIVEARRTGQRVVADSVYPLDGVTVLTGTLAKRIDIEKMVDGSKVANGVELADGRIIHALSEVIISSGAYRTPQLLLLSGIGPADELKKHGIKQIVESPEVGKNLWDHVGLQQIWKLRHPEVGASAGHPNWVDPAFNKGNPSEWYTTVSVPQKDLKTAISQDQDVEDSHPLLSSPRGHFMSLVQYAAPPPYFDGKHLMTFIMNLLPTARGTVTLASLDPAASPVIDNNHYSTQADRYRIREGIRTFPKLFSTTAGKEIVIGEVPPEGFKPLIETSTDREIDERLSRFALYV